MSDDPLFYMLGETKPKPARASSTVPLSKAEEQSLMQTLAKQTFGAIENLGLLLDTPGAITRGALADDPESGFNWNYDKRVSGEELLDQWGVEYENPYVKALAGLGTEIALDPMWLVTGPMKALTRAGKAAEAAGLLDLAPAAAARRLGGYDAAAQTLTGRFTDRSYRNIFPDIAQTGKPIAAVEEALKARPLLGPRFSRMTATLDDVVQSAPDPKAARKRLQDYLDANALSYDEIKDQNLGGALGFGLGDSAAVWSPKAAAPVLDAMDMVGQRLAWSAPTRYASAWFDKRMGQQGGVGDQIDMLRLAKRREDAALTGRRLASSYVNQAIELSPQTVARLGDEGLLGQQGGRALTRLFENVPRGADKALARALPGVRNLVDDWDALRTIMRDENKILGLPAKEYGDMWGVLHSPRSAAEVVLPQNAKGLSNAVFSTMGSEGIARKWYLKVPGGTDELREISVLPFVREHARLKGQSPYSNEQIGSMIEDWLETRYGRPVIGRKQSTQIANFMRNLNPDLPSNYPLFAEHPLTAQARMLVNHRKNVATAEFVLDKLTENAVKAYPSQIRGGGWRPLESAALDVSSRVGFVLKKDGSLSKAVQQQLKDRLAQRFPHLNPNSIDLSQMAIPQSVYDRLTKMNQVFQSPEAWKQVWSVFEKFTTIFKGFVLAWPSRHVRDAYSNAFSLWLETGKAEDAVWGMKVASDIVNGNYDAALPALRALPRYANLASDDAVRRQFLSEAGGTGVLSTLASSDLLSARAQASLNELVPGSSPIGLMRGLSEMVPDGSRNPIQMARDFFTIQNVSSQWNTRNPLLNSSQKINDFNDSIARLGGFIALLKQGVQPDVAAKRITDALVDYSSLTDIEKNVFKVIFPWWTYNSRMGRYVVQHLMNRPGGRYGQMIRAMNTLQQSDDDQYIPTALKQQFAFRIPDELLPYIGREPSEAVTTYGKDVDAPGMDLWSIMLPGSLPDLMQNLMNQSHPLIRTAGELGTNTDFFSRRPLDEAVTPLDRIYMNLFQTQRKLSPTTKAVVQNIPGIQRLVSLAGGLSDQRIPFEDRVLKQLINNLTGVKIQDVDAAWLFADLARKIADQQKGWMATKPIYFIPKELQPEAPMEVLKLDALRKRVEKYQKEALQDRKARQEFAKQ